MACLLIYSVKKKAEDGLLQSHSINVCVLPNPIVYCSDALFGVGSLPQRSSNVLSFNESRKQVCVLTYYHMTLNIAFKITQNHSKDNTPMCLTRLEKDVHAPLTPNQPPQFPRRAPRSIVPHSSLTDVIPFTTLTHSSGAAAEKKVISRHTRNAFP